MISNRHELIIKKNFFNEIYNRLSADCFNLRILENDLKKTNFLYDNDYIKEIKKMKKLLNQKKFFLHNNLFEESKKCLSYINNQYDYKFKSIEYNLILFRSNECLDLFRPLKLPSCRIFFLLIVHVCRLVRHST